MTADTHYRDEQARAPRHFVLGGKKHVIQKMRIYAGTPFDFGANNDTELLAMVDLLEETLKAAGWTPLNWSGMQALSRYGGREVGMIVDRGVVIGVEKAQGAQLLAIANALATALSQEGIGAEAKFTDYIPNNNHAAIPIIVGAKP